MNQSTVLIIHVNHTARHDGYLDRPIFKFESGSSRVTIPGVSSMDKQTVKVSIEQVTGIRPSWAANQQVIIECEDGNVYRADYPNSVHVAGKGMSAFFEAVACGFDYEVDVGGVSVVVSGGKLSLNKVSPVTLCDVEHILRHSRVYTSGRNLIDYAEVNDIHLSYETRKSGWKVAVSVNILTYCCIIGPTCLDGSVEEIRRMFETEDCPRLPIALTKKFAPRVLSLLRDAEMKLRGGLNHDEFRGYPVLTIPSADGPRIPTWLV